MAFKLHRYTSQDIDLCLLSGLTASDGVDVLCVRFPGGCSKPCRLVRRKRSGESVLQYLRGNNRTGSTRIVVGVSDLKVTTEGHLVTHALGSCIAICAWEPKMKIGGMLHFLLPSSKKSPHKASTNPLVFCDTGLTVMLERLSALGVDPKRCRFKIAGGAEIQQAVAPAFNVGKRNALAARKLLWKKRFFLEAEDVGGSNPRNVLLDVENGTVRITMPGQEHYYI